MSQSIDLQVLARYLDRIATDEDRAAVQAWALGDPARHAVLAQLEAAWRADAARLGAAPDADAVWARLSRQVGFADAGVRVADPSRMLRLIPARAPVSRTIGMVKWAAAIVGLTVAGLGAWRVTRAPTPEVAAAPQQVREYATRRGERLSFRLPDGSEVMLNAESRLRVPLAFGASGAPRKIELQGQGYFIAVHDSRRPFEVHTAYGVTRDVGTRFDIRAYPEDSVERVLVAEGEVAVRAAESSRETPLRAGQAVTVATNGKITAVPNAAVKHEVAWTEGRLVLRDVTLAEAARQLGRWYDLEVRIVDTVLMNRRVSGSYADEPRTDVLTVLTATVGARYELRGRVVTISLAD